jgi:hypothetical protein
MKTMLHKPWASVMLLVGMIALAVMSMQPTHAANPETVVNATGTIVYGTHTARIVKKDTSSGNRVAVRYTGGWQYVTDDAAWSKYGKLVAGMGARGLAVDNDPTGAVISVADSNGVYCFQGNTLVAWPDIAQGETVLDACAFWVKVKANAN